MTQQRIITLVGGPSDGAKFLDIFVPKPGFPKGVYEVVPVVYQACEGGMARYEHDESAGEPGVRLIYRYDCTVDAPLASDEPRLG